jgi:hypothetical protein
MLALVGVLASPANAGLPLVSDRVVDYRIWVSLDAVRHRLDGREHLVWRNPSQDQVGDLWFHLYLNAFKNTLSTFLRESGGKLRGDRMAEGQWGWIDITSMRLADGTDLLPRLRYEHPDDGNADDRTVARVVLPHPVPPGGTIALDISFRAQLPRVFARSGYARDYHLVGQWFPKLGVYEPAGMRGRATGGWNCHQYHANSEFYADFGHFLVDITVPSRFVVGATGQRTGRRVNADGTVTCTYEQADVHDFAWAADPNFVEVTRRFSAAREVTESEYRQAATLVSRPLEEMRLSDVDVTLLIQRSHVPQVERHMRAAFAGIKYFGLWYGRYPYPTLTVVDPAFDASGSAGMEYPTFITAGTSLWADTWPFDKVFEGPEGVIVHEFGHQFWYGMVANNEFEEAWLDEGITSYSTGRVMETVFHTAALQLPLFHATELDTLRMQNGPDRRFDAILTPSWGFVGDYGFHVYFKAELVLRTLENLLGRPAMARVMRTFQERWRFRHPSSQDFFDTAAEVYGRDPSRSLDLSSFFDQTIRGAGVLDYEVESISTRRIQSGLGVFDRNGKRVTTGTPGPVGPGSSDPGPPPRTQYESTVVVLRRGEVRLPVEIALKFRGLKEERVWWDGRDRWKRLVLVRSGLLEWAHVDPHVRLELDVESLHNSRKAERDNRVPVKWSATLVFVLQQLFAPLGF